MIEDLGKVNNINKFEGYWNIEIKTQLDDIKVGDSIAVNGVCLTVVTLGKKNISFDIITESLDKSNFSDLNVGEYVNLERCLRLSDRLGGHIVQGHVECVGKITSIENLIDGQVIFEVSLDKRSLKYCIYKGSITLDGISLTIMEILKSSIKVSIIPHTLKNTCLGFKKVNSSLNIETDLIAKYVEKNLLNRDL
ncbi:riboflavin synthase [Candidatus Marinimicrobia bacterium]|nr:riboflavin synthase [Candidatus Neomarinimicrobiota bacterium]